MRFFKDKNGQLHAIDDNASQEFIKSDWTELNQSQLDAFLKAREQESISPETRFKYLHDEFIKKVDFILNQEAKKKGYDNIVTAVTYAGYPNDFQSEGIAFGKWRSEVYKWGYLLEERFKNGELNIDSFDIESILQEMPKLNLLKERE